MTNEEWTDKVKWKRVCIDELRNQLEDVVNELDLSATAIDEHGQAGTCPSELVRLVLAEKDRRIALLKAGFKETP